MRKIVIVIISLLTLSLTLAAIAIAGYHVVSAANSKTIIQSSYYPSDWFAATSTPQPTPTIPFGVTWKSSSSLAADCKQLSLLETAEGRYSSCGEVSVLGELTIAEYRQYLNYLSQYAPFAYTNQPDMVPNTVTLTFGGHGSNVATSEQASEIAAWAESVYLRLKLEERRTNIIAAVRLNLAAKLGIAPDEITTEFVEEADWPNACLGLNLLGVDCVRVRTPGFRISLVTNGVRYEYRTSLYEVYRLAGSTTLVPTGSPATGTPIRPTSRNTAIPVASITVSPTLTPSATAEPSSTVTPNPTATPSPTATAKPTVMPSPTATATATISPSPTASSSPTAAPSPTVVPGPSATPNPTATATPTTTLIPTATIDPTATPSPTVTDLPTTSPTPSPSSSGTPG
jgi:hypothetical protein